MGINDDLNDFSSDDESSNNFLITSKKKISIEKDSFPKDEEAEVKEAEKIEDTSDKQEEVEKQEDKTEIDDGINLTEENSEKEANDTKEDKALKLKKRLEMVNALKKNNHKTGVIYLSRIPPYMKPAKMRQILTRFGQIDRLFLKRETDQKSKQRIKGGGNKKAMYEEGWAEFIRKRDAKLCAETLNGRIIGGKKGSFYHDDILNVKYLRGFKWADLTEQIARENDVRQAKLEMEISQANKLNAEFIRNVETSKMIQNIKKSKKRTSSDKDDDRESSNENHHRNFKQHKVATNRANAPENIKQKSTTTKISNVLNNIL